MGTELMSKDYITLLNEDIPNGRDDLINTSVTLEEVAEQCLNSYDKSIEQTVNCTAQALGSVAYKINVLATNFLDVLDQQNVKLNGLQTKVNHLNMQMDIHLEKSSRLSVGKFTLPRDSNAPLPVNVGEPIKEIKGKYRRKEIDFSVLDNIGHGIKDAQLSGSIGMQSSVSRQSSVSGTNLDTHQSNVGVPTSQRLTSDVFSKYGKFQTVGRASGLTMTNPSNKIYGVTGTASSKNQIPMASPSLSGTNMSSPSAQTANLGPRRSSSTSTGGTSSITSDQVKQHQSSNISTSHKSPMSPQMSMPGYTYMDQNHPMANIPPPPPPPPLNIEPHSASFDPATIRYSQLPPPPSSVYPTHLPPPPSNINNNQDSSTDEVPTSQLQPNQYEHMVYKAPNEPTWAPAQYISKVITIYAYTANKDDELSFQEDELIYVVKKNEDGWWEGVIDGCMGLFPGNYVNVIS